MLAPPRSTPQASAIGEGQRAGRCNSGSVALRGKLAGFIAVPPTALQLLAVPEGADVVFAVGGGRGSMGSPENSSGDPTDHCPGGYGESDGEGDSDPRAKLVESGRHGA